MELIKNLLKYFLILVVIILLAGCFIAGILFLFPNSELFGFKYVTNQEENKIIITDATVTKINIETNNYDIIIKPASMEGLAENKNLSFLIVNNYTGFSNTEKTCLFKNIITNDYEESSSFDSVNYSMIKSGSEYNIVLKEPTGAILYGDSKVVIFIPENAEGVEYNLLTNNGKISFEKNDVNKTKTLSTSNVTLAVNTAKGSFNLDNAVMKDGSDLIIKNYIGRVVINSEKIGNVKIDSNSGNFTFKNIGYEGFTGGDLQVSGNNPYITVGTIYGSLYFNSTTGYLKAERLIGSGVITTDNGIININKVENSLEVENESGEITINQINEKEKARKSINIETKSGTIKLGEEIKINNKIYSGVYSLVKVTSSSGKVNIENLYEKDAEIETTKGSVKVSFGIDNIEKNLKVSTVSGLIYLENVYGNITAKTENSSKITAKFYRISDLSSFTTDGGNIELFMPAPTEDSFKQYNLNILNRSNKLDINIGSFIKHSFDGEKNEEGNYSFQKEFPESSATTNTINIKTNNGKILIHE